MTWPRPESQHRQILDLLADGRKHTNSEIMRLEPRVGQYQRVISDCIDRGRIIESEQDKDEPRRWWYWLAGTRERTEGFKALARTAPPPRSRRPARPASSGMASFGVAQGRRAREEQGVLKL